MSKKQFAICIIASVANVILGLASIAGITYAIHLMKQWWMIFMYFIPLAFCVETPKFISEEKEDGQN